jgi:cytochrome c556
MRSRIERRRHERGSRGRTTGDHLVRTVSRMRKIRLLHFLAGLNARSPRVSSQRASRLYSGSQRTFGMGIVLALGCLFVPCWVLAKVPAVPGTTVARDPRLPIALAEARRENWKCLMRGHLQSLTESMRHLSKGEFEAAAAEANFGLAPGTVEYCREPLFTKEDSVRAATLPPSPAPQVRAMFDAMHTAARAFVIDARAASRSKDPTAAWKSLAALGDTCSACHVVYRID